MAKNTKSSTTQLETKKSLVEYRTALIYLGAALVPIASGLIAFATGKLEVTGIGIFSSSVFWMIYSLILLVVMVCLADFAILHLMQRRLHARSYRWRGQEAYQVYYVVCYVPWLLVVVPYLYWVIYSMVAAGAPEGAYVMLIVPSLFIVPMGGWALAFVAYEMDKILNPWNYD